MTSCISCKDHFFVFKVKPMSFWFGVNKFLENRMILVQAEFMARHDLGKGCLQMKVLLKSEASLSLYQAIHQLPAPNAKCKSFPETVSFTHLRLCVQSLVAYTCYFSNLQVLSGCLGENNITDPTGSFCFPLMTRNISQQEEQFLFFCVMQNTITEFKLLNDT